LAINSNLGAAVDLDRLLDSIEGLAVDIYTSNEAVGAQAEYIRDGLDYSAWLANVHKLLASDRVRAVHCMATINALCLNALPDLLTEIVDLKRTYGRDRVSFTLNILRFPSFQSPLVLPADIKAEYRARLQAWHAQNEHNEFLHEHELRHVQRLIDYLAHVDSPHSEAFEMPKLRNDFRQFYTQYDQRRGKDFGAVFPRLKEWYESIQI
jgi:hypothetical protein